MTMSTCRPSCGTDRTGPGSVPLTVRVRRVTTTRAGGVSAPPFESFNLGDHVGDDPAAVRTNRARLASAIGLTEDRLVWMNQIHGDHVEAVQGPGTGPLEATDALVTAAPRLALVVVTADCVPVLMADAGAGVVGAAHAGRVGAAAGIALRTVEAMVAAGARMGEISVLLGPAVSGPNYEVPEEMAADIEARLPGSRTTTSRGTPALDLRAGLARQLAEAGVGPIDVDPRCTVADRTLFSHRRDGLTGRLASLVWME